MAPDETFNDDEQIAEALEAEAADETIIADGLTEDGDDDLEAQMATEMAAEGLGEPADDDLEAQMAAAMEAEAQSEDDGGDVDGAMKTEGFKTLVAAVTAADLAETLSGEGPFTVFAPTDEAFSKLPAGTLESLLKPENKDKLIAILTYHVVPGKVMAKEVVSLSKAKTVQGSNVKIAVKDGTVMIDKAKVTKADIPCKNGVIHVIDKVILPKEPKA